MAWSSDHRRGPTALGLASIVALWFGCFDGAGALGYPCATDDDCGPSLACEDTGCCGGACLFGPGSTSDSTTSTSTTEDSTMSSSTTLESTDESVSVGSSSTGEPDPVCGNGVVEDGEECDDGEEGNGDWEPCTLACRNAILHFTSAEEGNEDFCDEDELCDPLWQRVDRTTGPWGSGPYGLEPTVYRLVSKEFVIPLPDDPMRMAQLELRHEFRFDVCMTMKKVPEYYDAAHVMLLHTQSGVLYELSPQMNDVYSAPPTCMFSNTPWCLPGPPPLRVFVGDSMGPSSARRALLPAGLVDTPLRLVFEVGFDEDNCMTGIANMPHPWQLHRVVVAVAPVTG